MFAGGECGGIGLGAAGFQVAQHIHDAPNTHGFQQKYLKKAHPKGFRT
jgi:hypothetical protein